MVIFNSQRDRRSGIGVALVSQRLTFSDESGVHTAHFRMLPDLSTSKDLLPKWNQSVESETTGSTH